MKRYHRLSRDIGDATLAKYENKCTKCGREDNLCVHHIIKMKPGDVRYNDLDNLTVLCKSCHLSHHRREGDIVPTPPRSPGNPYGRRGKIPPIKCSVEGCEKWQHGRALCKNHYEYKRRRGLL